jgi:hypothetical protein
MYCNVMRPAGPKRNGNNDNLVPVTFPVKEVFPHKQKSLKPLVASLEFCGVSLFPFLCSQLDA